jgi:hypothetical protein
MSLPKFLWQYAWARARQGGKWERWDRGWIPVQEWSTPTTHPAEYGEGRTPERENYEKA